jgi:hypothetical protein
MRGEILKEEVKQREEDRSWAAGRLGGGWAVPSTRWLDWTNLRFAMRSNLLTERAMEHKRVLALLAATSVSAGLGRTALPGAPVQAVELTP